MTAIDIISRKRDGHALSETEIEFIIQSYTNGNIPDYQMSAFLMAVYFQGMAEDETTTLVRLMRDSGVSLDLSDITGPKVDKHSTGGVGDKVSLVLAPLVAACGIVNPMISGRSLAHTGGTLDKLEAIPGFNTQLDLQNFQKHLMARGVAMIGQTPEICPADKKIYALRDATATVQSIPLICGSILSKKLAENLDALVLDVKCGNGAIFPDTAYSEKLAHALVATAHRFGLKAIAVLTQMDQPLGNCIGTWLETREAIEMLNGQAEQDFYDVTITLSAYTVWLGGLAETYHKARTLVEECLHSGKAMQVFRDMVQAQGGDVTVVDDPAKYPAPKHEFHLQADASGYLHSVDARVLGETSMLLGAGRLRKEDSIDYHAGLIIHKKVADRVNKGEQLASLYATEKPISRELIERAQSAFHIASAAFPKLPTILGIVDENDAYKWLK
ncbi:MAG: thymidine phosphorylase [bacterium]